MKPVIDYIHSRGLKFGMYTSIGPRTCQNYTGSWEHEAIDARTFADWGVDFLKHDYCHANISMVLAATPRMRDGLNATGRPIVYYVDASVGPRVFGDYLFLNNDVYASNSQQMEWLWGPATCNMWKIWLDHSDHWQSTMDNVHHMIGLQYYQGPGGFNMPDMMTIGQGGQSYVEYRTQMALWVVLASPLILGNNIYNISKEFTELVTHKEALRINRDSLCIQASLSRVENSSEIWIKPLNDSASFAVVLLNKNAQAAEDVTLNFFAPVNPSDFFPSIIFEYARIFDVWTGKDLGVFEWTFVAKSIPPHGSRFLRVYPHFKKPPSVLSQ
eukprot:TRINITY_DN19871_c0_g1_i1.p1 TRINITY_DN19871_c0_g1~~TRINITY_DN19871_c0_g1_i1.p1  ORF type:complete len:365 (-),score=29.80 TRINITY_DN19871_c0_g1_i1:23-1006(-)